MNWGARVFNYCERGADPSFWAEPINAVTNLAFLVVALIAFLRLRAKRPYEREVDYYVMVALIALIGIGSFLFHTFAARWAGIADVAPIVLFITVYLAFALNRYLRIPPGTTLLLTLAFAGICAATMQIRCGGPTGVSFGGEGSSCLNGSLGYVPALLALGGFAWLMHRRGHPAAFYLMLAGGVFLVSITLRSIDMRFCASMHVVGYSVGTHFMWHMLNATTLFFLAVAAIDHGRYGLSLHEVLPPPRSGHSSTSDTRSE